MSGWTLRWRRLGRVAVLISMVAVFACGDPESEGEDTAGGLGIDDGASRGESRVVLVRGDSEINLALSTGASVVLPAGAVKSPVNIGIKRPSDTEAVGLVASVGRNRKIASAPYVVTPHGTTFEKDVKLTLPVANAAAGKRLQVAWLENEQDKNWKVLGPATAVDKKVIVPLKHFSVLVLLEDDGTVDTADAGVDPGVERPDDASAPGDGLRDASPVETHSDGATGEDPRLDGGINVGGDVDGGVLLPEAAVDTRNDSGLPADEDPTAPDAAIAMDYEQQLYMRLQQCQMVSRQGEFSFVSTTYEQSDRCELQCLLTISCSALGAEFCSAPDSDETTACWAGCMGLATTACAQESQAQVAIRCDALDECLDGSDESNCPSSSYFYCNDGARIAAWDRCDGVPHCGDGADEASCQYGSNVFACSDGSYVPRQWECDGAQDCADASDERSCAGRLFSCASGQLIRAEWACNGVHDCDDGSDEGSNCVAIDCGLR